MSPLSGGLHETKPSNVAKIKLLCMPIMHVVKLV